MSTLAERVEVVVKECLFDDSELVDGKPPESAVFVDGIACTFGFHPDRVAEQRQVIVDLAKEIVSPKFIKSVGGGWSFLRLPFDKDDNQWGVHVNAEAFMCISIAAGIAGYCAIREHWAMLPGGLPYVWFEFP